jgi:hypothetical protein
VPEPIRYDSAADIAALFGVKTGTFETWQIRYGPDRTPEQIAKAPVMPQPDAYIGPFAGWLPRRREEFREWKKSLPGRGAGGGRRRRLPGAGPTATT